MHLSFQKVFYTIAAVVGLFAIMILAREVLIPLAFSFLVAFILFPVARKFESWGVNNILAAFLSMLCLLLLIAAGVYLFSNQIIQLPANLSEFKEKILDVITDATVFINRNFEFLPQLEKGELVDKIQTFFNESSGKLLSQTFSSTASIIFGILTSVIFTFLILIYRSGMIRALVSFYPLQHRDKALHMFESVQKVGQQYFFGMMVIVLILGFVNSIGLMIIGIDSPFLFGFLASVLAIIPYAGTFVGAAIPVLYAFLNYDSLWMPLSIVIFFWLVQIVESNFLTPKIVGGNLKINALTSILSIIIGAAVWGIAGMILFLPFAAMLKTVCYEYENLKPFAMLIGDENYSKKVKNDRLQSKWIQKIKGWFS
jgi:predicted PurR-regulated permease PerM